MEFSDWILLATEAGVEQASESGGVVGTLGLNLKLFVAQLFNFSIVLLILWKWVFKPVVGALEKRRQKIEDSVKKAEEIELKYQKIEANRHEELKRTRAEAQEILSKALAAADSSKTEIIQNAKVQANKILAEAKTNIVMEKEKMFSEIREEVANLTVMATEKILREKIDEKKDREFIEAALRSMK